ncbi:centrosomal protein of 85 kDa-like [Watersipora subatra]|uniref:centrosomal protein of 85 kDa-like n=1 Tax=Watersipora subatra TaxID=2589382 RepID=UPI00355AFD42
MAASTPVQSNVLGFEEVLKGEIVGTPRGIRAYETSSAFNPSIIKSTTILQASPSRLSPKKKILKTICNRCGTCESCESRQRHHRLSHSSPVDLESPDISERSKGGQSDVTSPFKPEFLTTGCKQTSKAKQNKWETVKAITETIIQEKDMLIERQKLKRLQLEQRVSDLEEKLRKSTLAATSNVEFSSVHGDTVQLAKEEEVYRRMTSSANYLSDSNLLSKAILEKSQLERQLGESEHKIAELKCTLLTQKSDFQQKLNHYKKMMQLGKEQEQALETKNNLMLTEGACTNKELTRLKLYLADLPTKEEYNDLSYKLTQMENDLSASKEHIEGLVDERSHMQEECRKLTNDLGESNDQVVQLLGQVSLLQKELSIWEEKEMLRDTTSSDDIVVLKEQQIELHRDYEKYKQLAEVRHQELATLRKDCEEQIGELTRQLEHAEMLVDAARHECSDKDADMQTLSGSLKQIQAEKALLEEQVTANEEKMRAAEDVVSSDTCKQEQRLVEEIVYCASSLQCLMDMYQNPNNLDLADMLATRPTPVTVASPREYKTVLEQQYSSLRNTNEKIEKLRQFVLDKYADDMASTGHIDCATQ